jgi:hypothetical protein
MALSVTSSPNVMPVNSTREVSPTPGGARLIAGELLEASVIRSHGDGNLTLQVKNMSIPAETRVPLMTGEKLTVRVEQTNPNIILRIVNGMESQKIGDLLRLYRSSPDALANLFSSAKDILNPDTIGTQVGREAAKSARSLLQALDASIYSRTTASNPLFLKDMMSGIGLLLERNILREQGKEGRKETVKELLLKLAGEVRTAAAAEPMDATLAFLEGGTKAIEAQQIATLLSQELDRSLVLQAACQFPAGIRMQDIFIDQEAERPDGSKPFHAVLFLSMDSLGEIIADASIRGNHLDCALHCETPETRDYLNTLLPELQDRLTAAGYPEASLRCVLERNMRERKKDYLAEKNLYSQHTVDIQT